MSIIQEHEQETLLEQIHSDALRLRERGDGIPRSQKLTVKSHICVEDEDLDVVLVGPAVVARTTTPGDAEVLRPRVIAAAREIVLAQPNHRPAGITTLIRTRAQRRDGCRATL